MRIKSIIGFTVIELMVVIAIMGILVGIVIVGYDSWDESTTVAKIKNDLNNATSAMENARTFGNGYPADITTLTTFIPSNGVILTGGSLDGKTYCINGASSNDTSIQYYIDSTISVNDAQQGECSIAPSAPTIAFAVNGANVEVTITPVTCVNSAAEYGIDRRTNNGAWEGYTVWSTNRTATRTVEDGYKYGYRAQARCYLDVSNISATTTSIESTYIDPIATPSAPVIATPATSDSTTTTWSWGAVSCPAGTDDNYQYDYFVDSVSQVPVGWKTPTNPAALSTIPFTTVIEDHTYTVTVQAKCFNSNINSDWSSTSNVVNYYRPITHTLTTTAGTGGSVSAGGEYSPGSTPTITATPNANYVFSSWTGSTGCSGIASHTITMNADKTCTAHFVATYTLTVTANAGGTVNTAVNGTYNTGSTPTITATPNTGSAFVSWTGSTGCSGVASHTITMNANKTCVANFRIYQLVGTIGAVTQGAASAAVTPAWGTSETRTAGNLLVCWVAVNAVATLPTTPAGWSIAKTQAGTSTSVAIFYKIAAGSDTAPTIAAITSGIIAARLAEFSGGLGGTPLDRFGSVSGTTSPRVSTAALTDMFSFGELIVTSNAIYYSVAAAKTLTDTINNATKVTVSNAATSTRSHYDFSYGYATTNATADSNSFAFTTTSITGQAGAIASFY